MRRLVLALLCLGVVGLATAALAAAFVGGGRKPSEAPLIAYGQHYTGQLNNQKSDANYGGYEEVAFWHLAPVGTRDTITVSWHVLPFTKSSGFPVCMALLQGVDDFSWGSTFSQLHSECNDDGPGYRVSGSGSAQTTITVQNADSSAYLVFFSEAIRTNPVEFETYPYDFSVEPPRHFLGLALKPKKRVYANGAIAGAVTLADGLPAPDGLAFNLTVTWPQKGIAIYTATTQGGNVVFPLALPESAVGERARFVVSHGADAAYQSVSAQLRANVKPPTVTAAEVACARAVQHSHTLARQLRRLKRNASRAHGQTRRNLEKKAHRIGSKLKRARVEVRAACPR